MTDVQVFLMVLVLFVTVAGIAFSVLRVGSRADYPPAPRPTPQAFREAQEEAKQRVAAYRRRQGGNDAA